MEETRPLPVEVERPVRRATEEESEAAYLAFCRAANLDPDEPATVALALSGGTPVSAEAAARRAGQMVGAALVTFDAQQVSAIRSAAASSIERPSALVLEAKAACVIDRILDEASDPDQEKRAVVPYEIRIMAAREALRLVEIAEKRGRAFGKQARQPVADRPVSRTDEAVRRLQDRGIEIKIGGA